MNITNEQARRFILLKQGLTGCYRFIGKAGVLDYIRPAGCIQFDPVDVCGRMAELTLQSRVGDFTKDDLYELLYKDRLLFDYPDKQLSIIPMENWRYYERYRSAARDGMEKFPEVAEYAVMVKDYITLHGAVCSDDLPDWGKIHWH